jgi:hypothetical protein
MPYGFSSTEWLQKSETERQVVRDWAYEQSLKDASVDVHRLAEVRNLYLRGDATEETYDNNFGGRYVFNKGARGIFNNTWNALNSDRFDTASTNLQNRTNAVNDAAREGYRGASAILREKLRGHSYSGCDITPSISIGPETFVLGNVSTISYSIHRDKRPVRVLGRSHPKSIVSAGRTIAGTIVFTVFDVHVLHEVRKAILGRNDEGIQSSPLSDQIPPFDVTVLYQNEYGQASYMRIYGVEIADEGQTHSVNDIYTENVMQYVARDVDLMCKFGDEWTPQALAATETQFNAYTIMTSSLVDHIKSNMHAARRRLAEAIASRKQIIDTIPELTGDDQTDYIAKRDALTKEISILTRQIDMEGNLLSEAETQLPNVRLGSKSSTSHDDPYNITRNKLRK